MHDHLNLAGYGDDLLKMYAFDSIHNACGKLKHTSDDGLDGTLGNFDLHHPVNNFDLNGTVENFDLNDTVESFDLNGKVENSYLNGTAAPVAHFDLNGTVENFYLKGSAENFGLHGTGGNLDSHGTVENFGLNRSVPSSDVIDRSICTPLQHLALHQLAPSAFPCVDRAAGSSCAGLGSAVVHGMIIDLYIKVGVFEHKTIANVICDPSIPSAAKRDGQSVKSGVSKCGRPKGTKGKAAQAKLLANTPAGVEAPAAVHEKASVSFASALA
jgi:hypothetical protein